MLQLYGEDGVHFNAPLPPPPLSLSLSLPTPPPPVSTVLVCMYARVCVCVCETMYNNMVNFHSLARVAMENIPALNGYPRPSTLQDPSFETWTGNFKTFMSVYYTKYSDVFAQKYASLVKRLADRRSDWQFYDQSFIELCATQTVNIVI